MPAAKVEVLVDDLAEIVQEGHQALVFSQFTSFLGRIRTRLDEAGIAYAYLDGRTRHRDRVVDRFRIRGGSVFLISLKAGGFGLNLTEANYCFVLDPVVESRPPRPRRSTGPIASGRPSRSWSTAWWPGAPSRRR